MKKGSVYKLNEYPEYFIISSINRKKKRIYFYDGEFDFIDKMSQFYTHITDIFVGEL